MGFEKRHHQEDIGELNVVGIRMKDPNGFYVDISQTDSDMLSMDSMASIRMNVDNFAEAYEILKACGFRNVYGEDTADTPTSKSAMMIAPSGFSINVIEHLKK